VLAEPEGQRVVAVDWSMYSIGFNSGETLIVPSDIPYGGEVPRGVIAS
jgi:hypothetical protein